MERAPSDKLYNMSVFLDDRAGQTDIYVSRQFIRKVSIPQNCESCAKCRLASATSPQLGGMNVLMDAIMKRGAIRHEIKL
jgi:hypothetical protein